MPDIDSFWHAQGIFTFLGQRLPLYIILLCKYQFHLSNLFCCSCDVCFQGSHRLEKYLNLEGFLEKSLKIKSALKSTGKSLKSLEKSSNSTIFCRT